MQRGFQLAGCSSDDRVPEPPPWVFLLLLLLLLALIPGAEAELVPLGAAVRCLALTTLAEQGAAHCRREWPHRHC